MLSAPITRPLFGQLTRSATSLVLTVTVSPQLGCGPLALRSVPCDVSSPVDSSPGTASRIHQFQLPSSATVGPSPVGDRLQVPVRSAMTLRLTSRLSTYQRVPSRVSALVS